MLHEINWHAWSYQCLYATTIREQNKHQIQKWFEQLLFILCLDKFRGSCPLTVWELLINAKTWPRSDEFRRLFSFPACVSIDLIFYVFVCSVLRRWSKCDLSTIGRSKKCDMTQKFPVTRHRIQCSIAVLWSNLIHTSSITIFIHTVANGLPNHLCLSPRVPAARSRCRHSASASSPPPHQQRGNQSSNFRWVLHYATTQMHCSWQ